MRQSDLKAQEDKVKELVKKGHFGGLDAKFVLDMVRSANKNEKKAKKFKKTARDQKKEKADAVSDRWRAKYWKQRMGDIPVGQNIDTDDLEGWFGEAKDIAEPTDAEINRILKQQSKERNRGKEPGKYAGRTKRKGVENPRDKAFNSLRADDTADTIKRMLKKPKLYKLTPKEIKLLKMTKPNRADVKKIDAILQRR